MTPTETPSPALDVTIEPSNALTEAPMRSRGQKIFLGCLGVIATTYLVVLSYHFAVPPAPKNNKHLLEQCRVLCQYFGLVPTGHIANDARAYLEIFKPWDLSGDLKEILSDNEFEPTPTQPHQLLGQDAPGFTLSDDRGEMHSLSKLAHDGPTLIVFYYGYGCSHCVAQLFSIDKDLRHFRELGANVVALSADSPQETSEKFAKYGRFNFPTLSDTDNGVAQKFGTYTPAQKGKDEELLHGTFLVSREGKILWAYTGLTPFIDNQSLLYLIAKEQSQLPAKPKAAKQADADSQKTRS